MLISCSGSCFLLISLLTTKQRKNECLIICFNHSIVLPLNGPFHLPKTPFKEVMCMKITNAFSEWYILELLWLLNMELDHPLHHTLVLFDSTGFWVSVPPTVPLAIQVFVGKYYWKKNEQRWRLRTRKYLGQPPVKNREDGMLILLDRSCKKLNRRRNEYCVFLTVAYFICF